MGKCPDCPPIGAPAYMTTYGDMMSLLLTFFIMLIAYSSTSEGKFKTASESIKSALTGGSQPTFYIKIAENINIPAMNMVPSESRDLSQSLENFLEEIKSLEYDKYVQVLTNEKGIAIRLLDPVLFDPGSDRLKPGIIPILLKIVRIAEVGTTKISIDGFTDDTKASDQFGNNWNLSAARAIAVGLFMIESGIDPQRFTMCGNAEFKPIIPNIDDNTRAMNRRVEIFLSFKDRYSPKELSPFAAWDEIYLRSQQDPGNNTEPGPVDVGE